MMQAQLAYEITTRADLADVLDKIEEKLLVLVDEDMNRVIQNGR